MPRIVQRNAEPAGAVPARWTTSSGSRPTLRLRPYRLEDLDDLHAMFSDAEHMTWDPAPFDRETGRGCGSSARSGGYRTRGFALWIIEDRGTGVFLGTAGPSLLLVEEVDRSRSAGIREPVARRGHRARGRAAARDWAFAHLEIDHRDRARAAREPPVAPRRREARHARRPRGRPQGPPPQRVPIDRVTWAGQTREEHGDRALAAEVPRVPLDRARRFRGRPTSRRTRSQAATRSPDVVVPRTATANGDRDELALGDRTVLVDRFHHDVRDVQRQVGELIASSEPERDQLAEQREERFGLGVGLPERGGRSTFREPWARSGPSRSITLLRRADAAELPVAAERGGDDLLGLRRLGADVLADARPSTIRLRRVPRPSTSTSTTSPGCTGREFAGVPDRITSPGTSVIVRAMSATR